MNRLLFGHNSLVFEDTWRDTLPVLSAAAAPLREKP